MESLFHAGTMNDQLGEYEKALELYTRAETSAQMVPIPRLMRYGPYHRGRIYHQRLKDGDAAIAELKRSLQIMQAQGARDHFLYPITLQRLGDVYAELKQNEEKSQKIYETTARIALANGQERFVPRAIERAQTKNPISVDVLCFRCGRLKKRVRIDINRPPHSAA